MTGIRDMGRAWATVLLALVLALRVVALPVVMAGGAPGPGMMAICTGAEIIYIPIGGEGPTGPAPEPHHDPCPAFGITATLDLPDLAIPAPTGRLVRSTSAPDRAARIVARSARAHQPRAPPLV